ncbi:MAG TPA: hypothetical protein VIK70_06280 [Lysobacter sp.]
MGDEHPGYAARLGPVSLTPYLWTFAVFVIPNLRLPARCWRW